MKFLGLALLTVGMMGCSYPPETTLESEDSRNFTVSLGIDPEGRALIREGKIYADKCTVELAEVDDLPGLKITTTEEFSDVYVDLEAIFGRTFNFRGSQYLTFDVYVPEGSWVASVKFNHLDGAGNFGGCGNWVNNLAPNQGRWYSVRAAISAQLPECRNWKGEGDFLTGTTAITINPYNANRVDTAVFYVNNLRLSDSEVAGDFLEPRLAIRPEVGENNPYTITFDDQPLLQRQLAYRTFEATTQEIASGKFGNPTNAIRAYGTGKNRFICLLPDIEQMTGRPVDFREVDSLFFNYYLTEESAPVLGATLFTTTGDDWEGILMDTTFMTAEDFVRGAWTRHAVAIKDIDYSQVKGDQDVLASVYEFRLDLQYTKDAGSIEIWYDDFGWK